MTGGAVENAMADTGSAASAPRTPGRHVSVEERRRLVAASLQVGNPGGKSRELPTQADPRHECQIELEVEDIHPYEHNPRRAGNARFAEIKESIRASGVRNPLTVTRRPGENHFIVEAGGNTRLLAMQQLRAETGDTRFEKLVVLFRPWRSESHVLTAHLIENEQRGEMTFWDKANGAVALKARLEAEMGRALSLRQLEEEMKALGLSVNTATLAHQLFATERLSTLGETVASLSGLDVKTMQPRLNAMKRYAQTHASIGEADLYANVFEPVFRRAVDPARPGQPFSAAAVCRACEEALAGHLGEPVAQVRTALAEFVRSPQLALEALPVRAGAIDTAGSVATAPPAVDEPPRPESLVSTANGGAEVPERTVSTSDAFDSDDEGPTIPARLIEQVRRFAALAGVDDCLRPVPTASLGYQLGALPCSTDQDPSVHGRHRAWSLLELISGQLDPLASVAVLQGSAEGDPGKVEGAHPAPGSAPNTLAFDAEFLDWLVDAQDQTASAFWDVLVLVRASAAAELACRAKVGPNPAPEQG